MKARVLRSVADLAPEQWDALCNDPVFSHGWFLALEESGAVAAEPRHIVLESAGEAVGILPCFVQRGDPYYDLGVRLFGPLRRPLTALGVRALPALLAYSPLAQRSAVFVAPTVDRLAALRVFAETMEQICRDEGLAVSGWPFASDRDPTLKFALHESGHRAAFLGPTASWRNAYASFDAYVASDCIKY